MRRFNRFSLLVVGVVGCYMDFGATPGGSQQNGPTNPGTVTSTDLPCSVAQALALCQTCHGSTPSGGAPIALVSYADLTAQSAQYPGQTQAQRSLARMQGSPTQMPPSPASPAPQADINAVNAWIASGYPAGSCNPNQSVCTSGIQGSHHEGADMRPGEACISCHQSQGEDAPIYTFMGTVYPTLHEPNDCVGATSSSYAGAVVTVIDAHGKEFGMTPGGGGNFMGSPASLTMPFTAKVTYQGREIGMTTPQTNGDCNTCHTEQGNSSAPGRITLP